MRKLVVLSGKGGTGKTSLTASWAALEPGAVIADCDVDGADLHILLEPEIEERHRFIGGRRARIRAGACIACGKCSELCAFDVIWYDGPGNGLVDRTFRVDTLRCEGCGLCVRFCPAGAIDFEEHVSGQWFVSRSRFGNTLLHARLGPAEGNSGKLSSILLDRAASMAEDLLLVDGPPGVGCPVIACLGGADLACLVTEPTASALHDVRRVKELADGFSVPVVLVLNKRDLHLDTAREVERWARSASVPIAGSIDYDPVLTEAQKAGRTVVEYSDGRASTQVREAWKAVKSMLSAAAGGQGTCSRDRMQEEE